MVVCACELYKLINKSILCAIFLETRQTAKLKKVDFRTAAYINAIQKIGAVYEGSGMIFMN